MNQIKRITASADGETMHMVASMAPAAEQTKRTVTGLVVPWNTPGRTSAGPVSVAEGAVKLPADLGRVKLLRDHSDTANFSPVGYATAAEVTDEGLKMSFLIAEGDDGDAALADVKNRVRDALSVELVDTKVSNGTLKSGNLTAVALVPIPAFAEARVEMLTAAATDPAEDDDEDDDDELDQDDETDDDELVIETDEQLEITDPETDPVEDDEDDETEEETNNMEPKKKLVAARVPSGLKVNQKPELTFSQAVETIVNMRTGTASPELTAKLADITRSANPAVSAPQWLGELWEGSEYQREIIPTMSVKPLTKLKAVGWRWTQKPEIEDYAGDKAEIPTNEVSTEPVETTANRMAVGHDIDRAYFDFNETEFLEGFFRARTIDYAMKSDAKAAAFLNEAAATGTSVASEPDLLHAAARARLVVKRQVRVEPSAYLVHPNSLFGLFDITQLDNPAYLDLLGVKPERFIATDLVPENEVVAYAKESVTWFELPGSPIRVDAERIDLGGRDSAVFAYWATLLNNQSGIVRVPFGAPVIEG
jgi:hypothetical protein